MRKLIKSWLLFGLAGGLLASCAQDSKEPNSSAELSAERVSFSLRAEVSVEDEGLRAIDHKLGANSNSQIVPMPQFVDKQEVEVHTILKSSTGTTAAKTLKWRYNATKKKLILNQDTHDIEVEGFNNDNSTKWYISGLIGGVLNGTQVEFMGTRVVKGVDGNAGDALGSMEVPYAFGWTELTIDTSSPKDSNNSHKYAEVPTSKDVKFRPMGSMLAVKLGNNQSAGTYTFTPKGFMLTSSAWGDQGSFEMNTAIPATNPHTALPTWTEGSCAGHMYYTFATGEEPGAIAHNQTTAKTYYVWVMPHKTVPTGAADVRVIFKGTSSRPETATYKDYTNTWFTDYKTEGKSTQGKVTQGRVHALTAKVSHRVALPIEYVTEYNLAGGNGLTHTVADGTTNGYLGSTALGGNQPAGVTGALRFATSHSNDQSGYYNGYKVLGLSNATYNPSTLSLQTQVHDTFGDDRYYIPRLDQWWGILPLALSWTASAGTNKPEAMRVGSSTDEFMQSYLSDFSAPFTTNNTTSNVTVYAIRFKDRTPSSCRPLVYPGWEYNPVTQTNKSLVYPAALDNSMKCAYRFTRVGGNTSWGLANNQNLSNQLIVDVVYLGEEATPTELATVSDESWWSTKRGEGKVISKTFPAAGSINSSNAVSGLLATRGSIGYYWSSSQHQPTDAWHAYVKNTEIYAGTAIHLRNAYSVRLFMRQNP